MKYEIAAMFGDSLRKASAGLTVFLPFVRLSKPTLGPTGNETFDVILFGLYGFAALILGILISRYSTKKSLALSADKEK